MFKESVAIRAYVIANTLARSIAQGREQKKVGNTACS
jgi:hypothetical protein